MTDNIIASLPQIVAKHVKGGWENVQSIDIKTGSSAALPVWNSKLDERWIGMPEPAAEGESGEESDSESGEEEAAKETTKKGKVPAKKSKNMEAAVEKKVRSSISNDAVASKPQRRAKRTT